MTHSECFAFFPLVAPARNPPQPPPLSMSSIQTFEKVTVDGPIPAVKETHGNYVAFLNVTNLNCAAQSACSLMLTVYKGSIINSFLAVYIIIYRKFGLF